MDEIREWIEDLREYAKCKVFPRITRKIFSESADMIESLSKNRCGYDWVPCSERFPEDGVDVLVWFEYFRYGEYNRLFQTTGISFTKDGKWSGFVNGANDWKQLSIIAWQPLPAPYEVKSDE